MAVKVTLLGRFEQTIIGTMHRRDILYLCIIYAQLQNFELYIVTVPRVTLFDVVNRPIDARLPLIAETIRQLIAAFHARIIDSNQRSVFVQYLKITRLKMKHVSSKYDDAVMKKSPIGGIKIAYFGKILPIKK